MVPKQFSDVVVLERLRLIERQLRTLADIEANPDRGVVEQLAVERILTQLVDLAVGINLHIVGSLGNVAPTDAAESFREAAAQGVIPRALAEALIPSVGMRNVLIHEYVRVDEQRVNKAVPLALEQFERYVQSVARWLAAHAG